MSVNGNNVQQLKAITLLKHYFGKELRGKEGVSKKYYPVYVDFD